jgi:hypothetical protein
MLFGLDSVRRILEATDRMGRAKGGEDPLWGVFWGNMEASADGYPAQLSGSLPLCPFPSNPVDNPDFPLYNNEYSASSERDVRGNRDEASFVRMDGEAVSFRVATGSVRCSHTHDAVGSVWPAWICNLCIWGEGVA